ncbi:MAG: anti-sigma factor [Opitutaceae bacterium]
MNCNDCRPLIDAHLDEELDVVNDAAVAAHLESCPACAETALRLSDQRRLLREKLTRHRAPADLAALVRAGIPAGRRSPATGGGRVVWFRPAQWTALAALLALTTGGGFFWGRNVADRTALVDAFTSAHARARLTGHVIDVESSDRHTVKPWFAGRVDFAPFVPDLAAQGFPLTGGRLDRVAGGTVATLVYGLRKHGVDLMVWTGAPEPPVGAASHDGFSVFGWTAGDLRYVAVTDASPAELAAFVDCFRGQR